MAKVFIISGLSGSGKDSVIDGLKQAGLDYHRIITTTTRPIRPGESQGNPYYFISEQEFKKMISQNEFFEWAVVYDNYYGNRIKTVEEALIGNRPIIFRIDAQGARTVRKKISDSIVIFLTAESLEKIKERLAKRNQDSPEVIEKRLAEAEQEMENLNQWDYVVINRQGKLKETINQVKEIIEKNFN
ncbi:MAG: guanylate kinase [Patescibacteria group bacterium]|jgi:guanylate kinase|nr:guanylate kinase [Patescibacteria group bacterium]MDD5172804.1 guanylate kinase [Patescibacteria group bacterium]